MCAVHVYTLTTQAVPTTHSEIKLALVSTLQSWAHNNQGKCRIIGTIVNFVMKLYRVGIMSSITLTFLKVREAAKR